jgi:hypothetical protein
VKDLYRLCGMDAAGILAELTALGRERGEA